MLSVIIPASNEAGYIGACLRALFLSSPVPGGAEVVVVANGCRDQTAAVAQSYATLAQDAGWGFHLLELAKGSKPLALNEGDRIATGDARVYLDADVIVSRAVMVQMALALSRAEPVYAGATPVIPRARSFITRAYARLWQRLPFARSAAPGFGLFGVNVSGRARWRDFPAIISDDTFVRLQFVPEERVQVAAPYDWPMIEGFRALVRVRRRQNAGVAELDRLYPGLLAREGKETLHMGDVLRLALTDPVGFCIYGAVTVAVRMRQGGAGFTRGR